jgi:AraC-like DNA-binding protein
MKSLYYNTIIIIVLFLPVHFSFCGIDTIPPDGRFVEPLPHSVINKDFVRLKIEVSDKESGIKEIRIFSVIDVFSEYYDYFGTDREEFWPSYKMIGEIRKAPYEIVWDLREVEDRYFGYRELYAEVEDNAGNVRKIEPAHFVQFAIDRNPSSKEALSRSHYSPRPVSINGILEEWPDSLFYNVSSGSGQARFASLWDRDFLYIGIEVKDKTLYAEIDTSKRSYVFKNSKTGYRFIWLGDFVELCFNPKGLMAPVRLKEHLEILYSVQGLVEGNNADFYEEKVYLWGNEVKTAIRLQGTLNDFNDQDTGYVIETAIPWADLGIQPQDGFSMGFDFFYSDFSGKGSKGVRNTWSGVNIMNNDNPNEWGRLVLTGKGFKLNPRIFLGIIIPITVLIALSIFFFRKKQGRARPVIRSEQVNRALHYIQENFNKAELDIEEIARAASISPNWLSTTFKKEMNKTVHGYLTDLRIENAKKLLQETNKNISQIAYEVGFKDQGHFTKVFKSLTEGLTPQNFRKNR